MGYLVLARKWRPRTFSEVVGQEHVTVTLQKAFEKGRLAHAYLFSGPRGCGKTTTARLLAKVINCENPAGGEPCDTCSSCLAVNDGTHLDMIEIDGASNRGIDEIRDLREKIGYSSSRGSSKIYIIDEVHMLTPQAFNALLKTLEEPPGHVYLVFATTEPHKVPATILSRCQRFNFKRLELGELEGQLEKICAEEGVDAGEGALTMICRRADGSMRDAESLLDQCISASDDTLGIETVREVLGLVDSQTVAALLDAVSRRDRAEALKIVDGVVSAGQDLEEFFTAFIEGIRNLLVLDVTGGNADYLDLTPQETEALSKTAGAFSTGDLLFLFRSMSRALREFRTAGMPRYHLEAAVTEAASWESAVELADLLGGESSGGPGRRVSPGPSRAGEVTGERPAGDGTDGSNESSAGGTERERKDEGRPHADGGSGGDAGAGTTGTRGRAGNPALGALGGPDEWERFLAQVRESRLTLGLWLGQAVVAGLEGGRLILSFSPQNRFAMEMIRQQKNRKLLERFLLDFYGRNFTVEAVESVDVRTGREPDGQSELELKARTGPGKEKRRKRGSSEAPDDAPMVGRIMEEFDGERID